MRAQRGSVDAIHWLIQHLETIRRNHLPFHTALIEDLLGISFYWLDETVPPVQGSIMLVDPSIRGCAEASVMLTAVACKLQAKNRDLGLNTDSTADAIWSRWNTICAWIIFNKRHAPDTALLADGILAYIHLNGRLKDNIIHSIETANLAMSLWCSFDLPAEFASSTFGLYDTPIPTLALFDLLSRMSPETMQGSTHFLNNPVPVVVKLRQVSYALNRMHANSKISTASALRIVHRVFMLLQYILSALNDPRLPYGKGCLREASNALSGIVSRGTNQPELWVEAGNIAIIPLLYPLNANPEAPIVRMIVEYVPLIPILIQSLAYTPLDSVEYGEKIFVIRSVVLSCFHLPVYRRLRQVMRAIPPTVIEALRGGLWEELQIILQRTQMSLNLAQPNPGGVGCDNHTRVSRGSAFTLTISN